MPRLADTIHALRCDCAVCAPPAIGWRWAALVAAGGTIALVIDLAGLTPRLAALLDMMP